MTHLNERKKVTRNGSFCVYTAAMAYIRDVAGCLHDDHVSLITGLIRARAYDRLCSIHDDLRFTYLGAFPNQVLFQLEAFFKKNVAFSDDVKCMSKAKDSFMLAEELCRSTNDRLVSFDFGEQNNFLTDEEQGLLQKVVVMRRTISRFLGNQETFLELIPSFLKVSSGATSTRSRKQSLPHLKMRKWLPSTTGALPYLRALYAYTGKQVPANAFRVVNCNRVAVVPKSWKTHRSIAAEPEGNLLLQLAVDTYMKQKFCLVKNSITDQTRNQLLAKEGSQSGKLATVDLSMASDTLSLELVPFLFPQKWSEMLLSLRTPYYKGEFGLGKWNKFSSMGNGFTFPIETLIFYAACKAVGSERVSVYGDDIIVDASKFDELSELLTFLGFTCNFDKTFHNGPFRESCGADYYRGENIRPFFVKSNGDIPKSELCHIINGLVSRCAHSGFLSKYLRNCIDTNRLPLVPWSDDSLAGIHVLPWILHDKRLFLKPKAHNLWVPRYRGYLVKSRTETVQDVRTLILWFLRKQSLPEAVVCTSEVSSGFTNTCFTTRLWQVPATKPADHLFWWSDEIAA